jgi:hypothetical protein
VSALLELDSDESAPVAPPVVARPAPWFRRPVAAVLLVLVAYLALSFLNSPRGYLGTDTGGKVATLEVMKHTGRFDPDLGYWAERWDPDGKLYPILYSAHIGHRWVNVTTLPALAVGYELYRVGGYRLALLVPMLGSLLTALAARALARRLRPETDGWGAFWLTALASPSAIYAIDFWEHSLGLALLLWAVVLLYDAVDGRRRAPLLALLAGVAIGSAATMRTEALVYGAVAAAVSGLVLLLRRRAIVPAILVVGALSIGIVTPLVANQAFERAVVGASIRGARAAGTASGAGNARSLRAREAATTAASTDGDETTTALLLSLTFGALLVLAVRRSRSDPRVATLAAAGAGVFYVLRLAEGPGFVPGLLAATPVAAVALAWMWQDVRARWLGIMALLALPLVWATQYTGGAAPQWAGRYILTTGALLNVVGFVSLDRLALWARRAAVATAIGVTGFGLVWLSIRSHDVARAGAELVARPEPVLVSQIPHLPREMGAFYGEKRWLVAYEDTALEQATTVVRAAGEASFGYVQLKEAKTPGTVGPFRAVSTADVPLFSGVGMKVTTYALAAPAP